MSTENDFNDIWQKLRDQMGDADNSLARLRLSQQRYIPPPLEWDQDALDFIERRGKILTRQMLEDPGQKPTAYTITTKIGTFYLGNDYDYAVRATAFKALKKYGWYLNWEPSLRNPQYCFLFLTPLSGIGNWVRRITLKFPNNT